MEIFTLLETLEDLLEKSKQVPFSEKTIIDKNEFLDIIKEIRLKLPDELKEAKWIKEEREKIIAEAQKDADDIVKEAKNRIIGMIDEHEITRKAYEKKTEIIANANERYREITKIFLQPFVTYIPSIPLIPKAVFFKMQPTVSKNSTFPLLPFKTVILRLQIFFEKKINATLCWK